MTLIDGDRIVTAQLYDDEHEEFTEKKMSIIDYVNAYTDEGVTTADDVLDRIRAEIKEEEKVEHIPEDVNMWHYIRALDRTLSIIDKYMAEGSDKE